MRARPAPPTIPPPPGITTLGLSAGRDGLLYIPPTYRAAIPAPLAVMLHGAGGSSDQAIQMLLPLADAAGLVVLAPDSRGRTWDFLYGPYGPDVAFLDTALEHVFRRCAVDPGRLAVSGFSDGASYALSLGLTNGDLFTHLVGFSPCILAPAAYTGKPRIFISHGTNDQVLPVERCGRLLAERLKSRGYDVSYREFVGRHAVPPEIARAAVEWMH